MKKVKVLSRFELAVFSTLAALVATLTLLLLNLGFQAPILVA